MYSINIEVLKLFQYLNYWNIEIIEIENCCHLIIRYH